MRVRVWICGADGPAHDFELIDPPRCGEQISIALDGEIQEGVVSDVSWHLIGVQRPANALALLEGEPVGAVAMVHVICEPPPRPFIANSEKSEEAATGSTDAVSPP